MNQWIYRLADSVFLRNVPGSSGAAFDAGTEGLVVFADGAEPNPFTQRFDASSPTKLRAATAQEMNDVQSAKTDADAVQRFDAEKLLKAVAISYEAYRLGKSPASLTNAELVAARTRIVNIYKAL